MNLEDQLRSALGRREPSAAFTARVLAAVPRPAPRRLPYRAAAWAAAAALLFGAGLEYRQIREGQRAKAKVMLALRIAAGELHAAQLKLERRSHPRETPSEEIETMENR
jgi:hypothetical protein